MPSIPLSRLEAAFYRSIPNGDPDGGDWICTPVENIADAQCVQFLCPKCFAANNGSVGTHWIKCWFNGRGVPDHYLPGPGRWNPSGTGLHDLTFVGPGATSVLLTSGCGWHGWIENGQALG